MTYITPPVLDHAAWWGPPAAALPVLAGLDPAAAPARTRWLAGVCLGALGRYGDAARWLTAGPPDSLAASCRASHLRQVGRHAEAEPLDRHALATATDPEACADALVGLVADAIGRHDASTAATRLATAEREIDHSAWRAQVRLAWVGAELTLLTADREAAIRHGRVAVERSLATSARRHAVKSQLVLGVALLAAERRRPAARLLRAAAGGADQLGLSPLLTVSATLLGEILQVRAPRTAAREWQRSDSARRIIE